MSAAGLLRRAAVLGLMLGIGLAGLPGRAVAQAAVAVAPAATSTPPADPRVDTKFDESLADVLNTLEDDQQRAALVDSLKKLQAARQAATGDAPGGTPANGLLGAISASFDAIQAQVDTGPGPRQFWKRRLGRAGREWDQLVAAPPQPWLVELAHFFVVLAIWGAVAAVLLTVIRFVERRLKVQTPPAPDAPTRRLLVFLLGRVLPWVIAFFVTVRLAEQRAQETGPSLGRLAALILAYGSVGGSVVASACILLFSLFGRGHRRPAMRVLLRRAPLLLFAAGATAAIGDVLRNARVEQLLGLNLAATASTAANLVAATLAAVFVLRFRRPVAHLLRNRSYALRQRQRVSSQLLEFVATLWHVPMLLLVAVSAAVTLLSPTNSEMALRRAIITALLLVLAFLATALVVRRAQAPPGTAGRRSPYARRFVTFVHAVVILLLWTGMVELTGRVWGHSVYGLLRETELGRRIGESLGGIGGTLLAAWFLWIVLDTAIQEGVAPSRPRRGRAPSTRALTVLPLVRNFTFITILTLGVIVTLANLGLNVAPLLAGAGVIGLAIGFGAQTLVKDLITGVFILIEDTLAIGDWVTIDTRSGSVESLTIRTVRLRDGDGAVHSIPFSSITTIKNQSREFGYAVFNVRVSYESDLDEAQRLIREAGAELQRDAWLKSSIISPLELWGLDRFEAGVMVLQGRIKTRPQKQSDVMRAFNRELKRRFDGSPTVYFASGVQVLRIEGGQPIPVTEEEGARSPSSTAPAP